MSSDVEIGGFRTVKDEKNSSEKINVYRVAVNDAEQFRSWLNDYQSTTKTQWIVTKTFPGHQRLEYRHSFKCAFSTKNKTAPKGQSRNFDCKATLDVKIKMVTKDTKKKDDFLRGSQPLAGIITVTALSHHSHNVDCGAALKNMRPGFKLKEIFMDYFHHGMSPADALRHHYAKVFAKENGKEIVADGHYMPLDSTVYYWHRLWRDVTHGDPLEPLDTLQQKILMYAEEGVTIKIAAENPWSVLIVTPIMQRVQGSFFAKRIVFVDTSASMDSTSVNVTIMMAGTKAGALPLAILLHEGQTTESYTKSFKLLQESFPNAFGGAEHPLVFMSDNSTAEKSALNSVWPGALQLLCGFHISQAEWNWLHSNADQGSKRQLMTSFQKIQYAKSTEDLEEAIQSLKDLSEEYYNARVAGLLASKEEWVQLFRADLPIGGHHTNNYAEASIRVLKDVILQRTKAFNAIALVDYITDSYEDYLKRKLSRLAYERISKPSHLYHDLVNRMPSEMALKIEKVDEDTYLVPSGREPGLSYEVVVSLGMCGCKAGTAGAFCKHQALLHHTHGGAFPNCPPVTSADRYLLGKLAYGSECPPKTFFLGMTEKLEDLEKELCELEELYSESSLPLRETQVGFVEMSLESDLQEFVVAAPHSDEEEEEDDDESVQAEFLENVKKMFKLGGQVNKKGFLKFARRANSGMRFTNNSNQAFENMMKFAATFKSRRARSSKKIRVQPAAIQRRKGPSKTNSRLPAGRPLNALKSSNPRKRKHCLAESIQSGVRHVKKH